MKQQKKYIVAATLLATLLPFTVSANSVKPASFNVDAGKAFESLESVSAIAEGLDVAVYCQSDVSAEGKTSNTFCFEDSDAGNIGVETEQAVAGLKLSPAEVEGETIPVRIVFRVYYSKRAESLDVVVLPNLGTMQEELGYAYSAPQERLDNKTWYETYTDNSSEDAAPFLGNDPMVRVASKVNARGKVSVAKVVQAEQGRKRDASMMKSAVSRARFIPGFVDNKPTEMDYVAFVHYR